MAQRSVLCLPVTSRNGEYLWVKLPAGAAPLPGRDEPRDVVAWSSVGVSLEVGRLLEKGCVGQSTNSATPPQNSTTSGVLCSLLPCDGEGLCMLLKCIH